MAKKKIKEEKLKALTPSGKREENFFELVYEVARQIPKGRVTSSATYRERADAG